VRGARSCAVEGPTVFRWNYTVVSYVVAVLVTFVEIVAAFVVKAAVSRSSIVNIEGLV
jgi:DNA-binding protein